MHDIFPRAMTSNFKITSLYDNSIFEQTGFYVLLVWGYKLVCQFMDHRLCVSVHTIQYIRVYPIALLKHTKYTTSVFSSNQKDILSRRECQPSAQHLTVRHSVNLTSILNCLLNFLTLCDRDGRWHWSTLYIRK